MHMHNPTIYIRAPNNFSWWIGILMITQGHVNMHEYWLLIERLPPDMYNPEYYKKT